MEKSVLEAQIQEASQQISSIRREIEKVIVGQKKSIDRLLIALLCDGHLLVEGVPGIAKTLLVTTIARVMQLEFKRIQFTPDLLPADLIGTTVYNPKESTFFVQKGPIFANIVLADEINRAPPKVQSALLEIMQERQVTIGKETHKAHSPFFVLATQNPIEHEGVYPLPEAETDRFMMKVKMEYPTQEEEKEIVSRFILHEERPEPQPVCTAEQLASLKKCKNNIYVDQKLLHYITSLVVATREPERAHLDIANLIEFGASPRASLALTEASKAHAFLEGRSYVTPYDVKEVAFDVLRHRLILSYEAEAEEISCDMVIKRLFEHIPVP